MTALNVPLTTQNTLLSDDAMNDETVIIKRSPSTVEDNDTNGDGDADDDDVMQVGNDSRVEDDVADDDLRPSIMLLPLPLHLQNLKDSNELSDTNRNVIEALPQNLTTSIATASATRCVMNLVPSPMMPSVDLMTALATLKAEFIQNYIVAMISRKVRRVCPFRERAKPEIPIQILKRKWQ